MNEGEKRRVEVAPQYGDYLVPKYNAQEENFGRLTSDEQLSELLKIYPNLDKVRQEINPAQDFLGTTVAEYDALVTVSKLRVPQDDEEAKKYFEASVAIAQTILAEREKKVEPGREFLKTIKDKYESAYSGAITDIQGIERDIIEQKDKLKGLQNLQAVHKNIGYLKRGIQRLEMLTIYYVRQGACTNVLSEYHELMTTTNWDDNLDKKQELWRKIQSYRSLFKEIKPEIRPNDDLQKYIEKTLDWINRQSAPSKE